MRLSSVTLLVAACALALPCGLAAAKPTSDKAFRSMQERIIQQRPMVSGAEEFESFRRNTAGQLDLEDLRPSQMSWLTLHRLIDTQDARSAQAMLRVGNGWKGRSDGEGAAAAALVAAASITARTTAEQDAGWVRAALTHPGLRAAVRSGDAALLSQVIVELHPDVVGLLGDELAAYGAMFDGASTQMVWRIEEVYETIAGAADGADLDSIHASMMGVAERAARDASRGDLLLAVPTAAVSASQDRLEKAPALVDMVGKPAPELTFIWDSDPRRNLRGLKDLRGKVVLLDFWATWCGPCIASFPQVRAIVDHYEGYPVEVIGVTSPQGYTIFPGRGRVQASSDRQEFQQMEEAMRLHEITWTVAFSRERVFNPDYGIRGIPHLVIIDPDGNLRHRGLHPGSDLEGKVEMINALLQERGLAYPKGRIAAPLR